MSSDFSLMWIMCLGDQSAAGIAWIGGERMNPTETMASPLADIIRSALRLIDARRLHGSRSTVKRGLREALVSAGALSLP